MCHFASDKKFTVLASKCLRNRLVARLRPDPLGELTAPPDPIARFRGGKKGREEKEGVGKEEEGK